METHENSPTGVETSSQTEATDLLGFVNSETTTKHDESSEMCLLRFFMLLLPKTLKLPRRSTRIEKRCLMHVF